MRRPTAVLASLLGALPAQDPQPTPPAPAPKAEEPLRLYDFVVAMVGDKAILASQVTDHWRDRVKSHRETESASRRNLLWYDTVELFITREMQAQSARLMGRSPEEVDAQVERIMQEELRQKYEAAGGLNEFVRRLSEYGGSMNTVAEETRTDILSRMLHYQGILRELQDQLALLATPKEMHQRFLENPRRFEEAGKASVAAWRVVAQPDSAGAMAQAEQQAAAWKALPRPLTAESLQAVQAQVIEVPFRGPASVFLEFALAAQPGDVSPPRPDGQSIWVLALVSKTESRPARFEDPAVQQQLRNEIARQRRQEIYNRLFQERRVGVDRLPWGEPSQMEGRRTPPRRR